MTMAGSDIMHLRSGCCGWIMGKIHWMPFSYFIKTVYIFQLIYDLEKGENWISVNVEIQTIVNLPTDGICQVWWPPEKSNCPKRVHHNGSEQFQDSYSRLGNKPQASFARLQPILKTSSICFPYQIRGWSFVVTEVSDQYLQRIADKRELGNEKWGFQGRAKLSLLCYIMAGTSIDCVYDQDSIWQIKSSEPQFSNLKMNIRM